MTETTGTTSSHIAQDLLVALCGLLTSSLTAMLLWIWESRVGVGFYTITWWFVIPVGAIASGMAGASGYLAGSWLFGHRPSRLLLVNVVLTAISTFFLIHLLAFLTFEIDGRRVSDVFGFWQFLDVSIRTMSFTSASGAGGGTELGGFGYVMAALQVAGFSIGGFFVYRYLAAIPHCEKCSRYFSDQARQERYVGDPQSERIATAEIPLILQRGDVSAAVDLHGRLVNSRGQLRSVFHVRACGGCGLHMVIYSVEHLGGNEWKEMPQFRWSSVTRTPVALSRTSPT